MKNGSTPPRSPSTRKRPYVLLSTLADADPEESDDMRIEYTNYRYLLSVREYYERSGWKWGAPAEFLFSCLMEALDLGEHDLGQLKSTILAQVRPKRGRPRDRDRDARILRLKAEGKNIRQITTLLKAEYPSLTSEAVRDCLKPRRQQRVTQR
jgi:hypothetical protein